MLTGEMRRVVEEQRLGLVATVCEDGTPNLSSKGTVAVWDDDHLVFGDIRSPATVANLLRNPSVEINVVDPISRVGYRFRDEARVVADGRFADEIRAFYAARGTRNPLHNLVMVRVLRALPIRSPLYDLGLSEDEVRARWTVGKPRT